jgi:Immunity protein 26
MAKRSQRTIGDVVRIDLGAGFHTYARVLQEAGFAFYDCRAQNEVPIAQVVASPVLFQIAVMNHAVTKGRWSVIGHVPPDKAPIKRLPQFIQDPLRPENFSIYENGAILPATRAEAAGLERAAVWDPEHVEDRLRDHYSGRPNKWLESMKFT